MAYFWIQESDVGNRASSEEEHYLVFAVIHDGSIDRYIGKDSDEYEAEQLIPINQYVRALQQGIAIDENHTIETLFPQDPY